MRFEIFEKYTYSRMLYYELGYQKREIFEIEK